MQNEGVHKRIAMSRLNYNYVWTELVIQMNLYLILK